MFVSEEIESQPALWRRAAALAAISRSGTTTEVVDLARRLRESMPVIAITAQGDDPLAELATTRVSVVFADERSVVQTRFATCTVALFRVGLAHEAALKVREAAQAWSEAYPMMEYRHGPISVADEATAVWALEPLPAGLEDQVRATGAAVVNPEGDPLAELVRAQRFAVDLAVERGLDPDRPRNLARSVVLEG